jgi:hypothetical protein
MCRTQSGKFGCMHAVPASIAAARPQGKFRAEWTIFGKHSRNARNHRYRCVERPRACVRIARGALHDRHAQRSLHELR